MFPPLDILLEYWIGHVSFGLLYVMFTFPTRIVYRGVPGFATDCPCGVWCRGLTTCPLYVDPFFWKSSLTWIRKSKDYVYGIWVYKALDIWKGYYRVKKSLVSYMKPWTEARNNKYMKYHSKLTYQLSFWNVSRKVDYHAGGKWFIHGPKRRKENQLLSLKHPCWLSLV